MTNCKNRSDVRFEIWNDSESDIAPSLNWSTTSSSRCSDRISTLDHDAADLRGDSVRRDSDIGARRVEVLRTRYRGWRDGETDDDRNIGVIVRQVDDDEDDCSSLADSVRRLTVKGSRDGGHATGWISPPGSTWSDDGNDYSLDEFLPYFNKHLVFSDRRGREGRSVATCGRVQSAYCAASRRCLNPRPPRGGNNGRFAGRGKIGATRGVRRQTTEPYDVRFVLDRFRTKESFVSSKEENPHVNFHPHDHGRKNVGNGVTDDRNRNVAGSHVDVANNEPKTRNVAELSVNDKNKTSGRTGSGVTYVDDDAQRGVASQSRRQFHQGNFLRYKYPSQFHRGHDYSYASVAANKTGRPTSGRPGPAAATAEMYERVKKREKDVMDSLPASLRPTLRYNKEPRLQSGGRKTRDSRHAGRFQFPVYPSRMKHIGIDCDILKVVETADKCVQASAYGINTESQCDTLTLKDSSSQTERKKFTNVRTQCKPLTKNCLTETSTDFLYYNH